MMMSLNAYRITSPLWGESIGDRGTISQYYGVLVVFSAIISLSKLLNNNCLITFFWRQSNGNSDVGTDGILMLPE